MNANAQSKTGNGNGNGSPSQIGSNTIRENVSSLIERRRRCRRTLAELENKYRGLLSPENLSRMTTEKQRCERANEQISGLIGKLQTGLVEDTTMSRWALSRNGNVSVDKDTNGKSPVDYDVLIVRNAMAVLRKIEATRYQFERISPRGLEIDPNMAFADVRYMLQDIVSMQEELPGILGLLLRTDNAIKKLELLEVRAAHFKEIIDKLTPDIEAVILRAQCHADEYSRRADEIRHELLDGISKRFFSSRLAAGSGGVSA